MLISQGEMCLEQALAFSKPILNTTIITTLFPCLRSSQVWRSRLCLHLACLSIAELVVCQGTPSIFTTFCKFYVSKPHPKVSLKCPHSFISFLANLFLSLDLSLWTLIVATWWLLNFTGEATALIQFSPWSALMHWGGSNKNATPLIRPLAWKSLISWVVYLAFEVLLILSLEALLFPTSQVFEYLQIVYFFSFLPANWQILSNVHAKSLQSCLTLCDPIDHSLPWSMHRILQARILKWVAMPFSRRSSWHRYQTHISYVSCFDRCVLYHWWHLGSPFFP